MESQNQRINVDLDEKVNRAAAIFAILREEAGDMTETERFRYVRQEVQLSERKLADAYNISTNYDLKKNDEKR